MSEEDLIARVNALVLKATEQFNSVAKIAKGLERIPLVGKIALHSRLGYSLDTLRDSFNLGYVPEKKGVEAWQTHDLVTAFNLIYHPDNRKYFAEISSHVISKLTRRHEDVLFVFAGNVSRIDRKKDEEAALIGSAIADAPHKPNWGKCERTYWLNWHATIKRERKTLPSMGFFAYTSINSTQYKD